MNLPNKLTIFRILLIPVIMIVYAITPLRNTTMFYSTLSVANFIILILVFIGAMTDYFDGQIARKRNLVTTFGKFLDPIADKLLVVTILLILMDQNLYYQTFHKDAVPRLLEWWMVAIVLAREFIVSGIRLIAVSQKRVIAASWYGKIKTTLQFITILFLLAGCAMPSGIVAPLWYVIIAKIMLYAMMVVTIFSGADYVIKNKDILLQEENGKKKKKTSL